MKDYTIVQLQKGERKRCRQWRIDLKDGRYPSGKQKYKSQRFEGTYTQAVARAEELSEDRTRLRSKWTVESYFRHVNDTKLATGQIGEASHKRYLSMMRHVFEWIGTYNVSDVRPSDIERIYVRLKSTPTRRSDGWSGTSINILSKILHNMFEHARRERLVATNPVDDAIAPRKDTKEREAMGFEESLDFEARLDPTNRYHLCAIIAMEAGLRIGEICGLRWDDIEGGYIHVRRTMHSDGRPGKTKTQAGMRVVPISATLAAALGAAPRVSEWVVGSPSGKPLNPCTAGTWWAEHRGELGMEGWTLHQFRHQFATNLARQGVSPRTMQALLGHSSPVTSLQIYTHVEKEQTVDAIAQVEAARRIVAEQRAREAAEAAAAEVVVLPGDLPEAPAPLALLPEPETEAA